MRINVTKSSLPDFKEYCDEIRPIWESFQLTNNGPIHKRFEAELEKYLDVKNAVAFVNGHSALEAAIQSFHFPEGSEIITTPFTFVSTVNAIVRNHLTPVFCDIKDSDFTIDPEKIESLITSKTVAILGVHVYGNVCDINAIGKIAKKYSLVVIYDAAHAFGVKYKGKGIGAYGDISMFSFHATKVFNSIEGGCLTFNNDTYKRKLKDIKNFGIDETGNCYEIGGNAKMNEFQAAMGVCNLRHISEYIEKRRVVFERYLSKLDNVKGIYICKKDIVSTSNYSYFPVIFNNYKYSRDEVYKKLAMKNIFAREYFFPVINEMKAYLEYDCGNTPKASFYSKHVLCLPLYSDLNLKDVDEICRIILE